MRLLFLVLLLTLTSMRDSNADILCRDRVALFAPHLKQLKTNLKLRPDESQRSQISRMIKGDVRRSVFQLEGLARIFKDAAPLSFEKMKTRLKDLEDALGELDERIDYLKFAMSLNADEDAIKSLKARVKDSRVKLAKLVSEWTRRRKDKGSRFNRLVTRVKDSNEVTPEENRRLILKALVKHIQKIEELPFDTYELQKGTHEMRRQLRWILIYMQAAGGLFTLDDGEAGLSADIITRFGSLVRDPIADKPINQLPLVPEIENPIHIHRILYLAISKAVSELGEIKTFGERVYELERVLSHTDKFEDFGRIDDYVKDLIKRQKIIYIDVHGDAEKVRQGLTKSEVLKTLREEIEKQIH